MTSLHGMCAAAMAAIVAAMLIPNASLTIVDTTPPVVKVSGAFGSPPVMTITDAGPYRVAAPVEWFAAWTVGTQSRVIDVTDAAGNRTEVAITLRCGVRLLSPDESVAFLAALGCHVTETQGEAADVRVSGPVSRNKGPVIVAVTPDRHVIIKPKQWLINWAANVQRQCAYVVTDGGRVTEVAVELAVKIRAVPAAQMQAVKDVVRHERRH